MKPSMQEQNQERVSAPMDLEFARRVIQAEADGIAGLIGLLEKPDFSQAVEMLFACTGSVIVTGVGKAGIIGKKISGTLASTGTPSHFLHPTEALHGDLGRISDSHQSGLRATLPRPHHPAYHASSGIVTMTSTP